MGMCCAEARARRREDVAAVEHAGSAVDDQVVAGEVFRKIGSCDDIHREPFAYPFAQQARNLDASDVLRCRGVGARFGYQYPRLFRQAVYRRRPFHKGADVALVIGEKDGEGGEQAFGRCQGTDRGEGLASR